MYLFGGSNGTQENNRFFKLDLKTFEWEVIEKFGENSMIQPRDSHSAVLYEDESEMYIFGGFSQGQRTNEVYVYNLLDNNWHTNFQFIVNQGVNILEYYQPSPRNGHSACVYKH